MTQKTPSRLLDAFSNAVETYINTADPAILQDLRRLTILLLNCSDILPRGLRSDMKEVIGLYDRKPNTYAQAARLCRYAFCGIVPAAGA